MAKNQSVHCPDESHEGHKKTLVIIGKNSLKVFCKMHGWVNLELYKSGERINFEGVNIIAKPIPRNKHIDTEPIPILSVGEFETK